MVKILSNIARKEKSPDVDSGGSTAVVGSTYTSAKESLEEGARDASPVEESTLGCLELAFN